MAKLTTAEMIEAIKELSVLELNELVKACEEEFGVSAAAGVVVAAAGAAEAAEAAAGAGSEGLMKMLSGFTVKRMLNLMGTAGGGKQFTKEELLELNSKLNKIKR